LVFCGSDKKGVEGKILKYDRVLENVVYTLNDVANGLSVLEMLLHVSGLQASEEGMQNTELQCLHQ